MLPLPPVKLLEFSSDESVEDLQRGTVYNDKVDVAPELNGELRVDVSSSTTESSDPPVDDGDDTDSESTSEGMYYLLLLYNLGFVLVLLNLHDTYTRVHTCSH